MEIETMLVAVDFRPPSLQAARWAATLVGRAVRIELAHVAPARDASDIDEAHRKLLAGLTGFASTLGAVPAQLHVRFGDPAVELCALARARGSDLMVLGRNAEGGDDGRTRDRLLSGARVPVLVVGGPGATPPRRIVAALDAGPAAAGVLAAATAIVDRSGGELVQLHVPASDVEPAGELLEQLRREPADLLVIGRNASADDPETLGRTTRLLARGAPIPVLVIPPEYASRPRPPRAGRGLHSRAVRALALHQGTIAPRPSLDEPPPHEPLPAA